MLSKENFAVFMMVLLAVLVGMDIFFGKAPDNCAYAAGASGSGRFAVAVAGIEGSSAEVVYLFDEVTMHLVTYHQSGKRPGHKLELLSIRDLQYDVLFDDHNLGKPTPEELRKRLEKLKAKRNKTPR